MLRMTSQEASKVRCPKCLSPEPDGATHCRMCFSSLRAEELDEAVLFRRAQATAAVRAAAARPAPARLVVDPWVTRDAVAGASLGRVRPSAPQTHIPGVKRRTDTIALLAFIFGLCGGGPVAVVLGIWGRRRVHACPARGGYGLASAGMWLGLAATAFYGYLLVTVPPI